VIDQLKEGGRLIAPVEEEGVQNLVLLEKSPGWGADKDHLSGVVCSFAGQIPGIRGLGERSVLHKVSLMLLGIRASWRNRGSGEDVSPPLRPE
jgi:protein-L-isoaspartate O-methyltransferase